MARIRLDKLVVKRDIADNLESARTLIESGDILVNGSVQKSPASFIDAGAAIERARDKQPYVSRGGLKLAHALTSFAIDVSHKRCLDVGSSTGGFTDCLLQHGASHVVAVDVGRGQLDVSLRDDERVSVWERTNVKDLTPELIDGLCDLAVVDVSFTSVVPLMDAIISCLKVPHLVLLFKPQFECEPKCVNTQGIVTDPHAHKKSLHTFVSTLDDRCYVNDIVTSPIKGAKGNIEFLCEIVGVDVTPRHDEPVSDRIDALVDNAHVSSTI